MPQPTKHVGIADIAREAGVGLSTVSRVLRGQGSYSKRAGELVAEAAARLGYVPNRLAGHLAGNERTAGSRLVGVIIPSFANVVFPDVLRGLSAALDVSGFQCVVGVTDYDTAREEALVSAFLSWRPAALVVTGRDHLPGAVAKMKSSGVRIVEIFDTDGPAIDIAIGFSNAQAGRESARRLVDRGYAAIGYVGHDLDRDVRARRRLAGFEEELGRLGRSLLGREVIARPSSPAAGREGLSRLLARSPELDAVYFSNDDMALGGYFGCMAEGLAVPDRVALFGFNGLEIVEAMPRRLSTIRTPRLEIGRLAADRLAAGGPPETIDLGFELIEGETA